MSEPESHHFSYHSPAPASDSRLILLRKWLQTVDSVPVLPDTLRPASADASFRRYFRIDTPEQGSLIVMDAPPPQEDTRPFIRTAELFASTGISVPQIITQNVEQGFLLLSDLGSTTYLNQLTSGNNDSAHKLYLDAIDALILLQTQSKPRILPEYNRTLLSNELQLFPDWYVGKYLKTTLSDEQTSSLHQVYALLLANNLTQAQVYVHRDYHSRNLMVLPNGNPGVLDFQDAVYGPITYDLVSLLRDAYIQWDEEMVLDWAIRYWERAKRAGLPVAADIDAFYRDFEFMGLQRHLKILGIFARLYYRDGKDAYLKDMPLVMHYVMQTARRYTVLRPLVKLLEKLENQTPQIGYTF